MDDSKFLSIGETAKVLEVTSWTLRSWDKKGILKSFQPIPGMHRRYKKDEVEAFLQKRKTR